MATIQSINPATGEVVAEHTLFSEQEVQAAIERAHESFLRYRTTSIESRGRNLMRMAALLSERRDEYGKLIASEMGKPRTQAAGEVMLCAAICSYYAENAPRLLETQKVRVEGARDAEVRKDPLGIVFGIMPWNFPFYQVIRYVAPNLMAGNTCLLKHASNVFGCGKALEQLVRDAGFPEGVFQNLPIRANLVEGIVAHPKVRGVTLTGSESAGRQVGALAGQHIKRCVLELGGSDPFVVLDDADPVLAVKSAAMGRLYNNGQSCVSPKRIIVDKKLAEPFIAGLKRVLESVRPGDPLDPATTVGPMARADLRDELHDQVERAVRAGAKLLVGGKVVDGPGAFYPPTLLVDVDENNPAFQEELFGPVAVVTVAKDEEHALALANNSRFGLGGTVLSADLERGKRFAARLDAGMCYVNQPTGSPPELPFGGVKDSGFGRELGEHGISEFLNVRTVFVAEPARADSAKPTG